MSESIQGEIPKIVFYGDGSKMDNTTTDRKMLRPQTYSSRIDRNFPSKRFQKDYKQRSLERRKRFKMEMKRAERGMDQVERREERNWKLRNTKDITDKNVTKSPSTLKEDTKEKYITLDEYRRKPEKITKSSTGADRADMWRRSELEQILATGTGTTAESSTQTPPIQIHDQYHKITEEAAEFQFGNKSTQECQEFRIYRLPGCSLLTGTIWCRLAAEIVAQISNPGDDEARREVEKQMQKEFTKINKRTMMEINNNLMFSHLNKALQESRCNKRFRKH